VRFSSGVLAFESMAEDMGLMSPFSGVSGMIIRNRGGLLANWCREGSGNREMVGFLRVDRLELERDIPEEE
jgi:hypothetical protein